VPAPHQLQCAIRLVLSPREPLRRRSYDSDFKLGRDPGGAEPDNMDTTLITFHLYVGPLFLSAMQSLSSSFSPAFEFVPFSGYAKRKGGAGGLWLFLEVPMIERNLVFLGRPPMGKLAGFRKSRTRPTPLSLNNPSSHFHFPTLTALLNSISILPTLHRLATLLLLIGFMWTLCFVAPPFVGVGNMGEGAQYFCDTYGTNVYLPSPARHILYHDQRIRCL